MRLTMSSVPFRRLNLGTGFYAGRDFIRQVENHIALTD